MDELQSSEESAFVQEDVTAVIKEVIEGCVKRLKDLNKPFKYIVTSIIVQKNGAGLHMATSCFWDNTSDGSATLRWENKTMYCITTVFGLAI